MEEVLKETDKLGQMDSNLDNVRIQGSEKFQLDGIIIGDSSQDAPDSVIGNAARSLDIATFTTKTGFLINKKKMRRLMEMDDKAYESFKLEAFISKCCRELDLENAYSMYQAAKAKVVRPNNSTFCNLLSLVAGLGDQGSGAASVRQVQPPNNITYAFQVYEDMRSHHIPLQECDFTAMIRCCCCNNCSDKALSLYKDMQSLSIIPKLRTFYPLLRVLLTDFLSNKDSHIHEQRIQDIFFVVFEEVFGRYNLIPTEREYLIAIEFAAVAGDSTRFYAILHSMMEDVLVPESELCWTAIERCFSLLSASAMPGGSYTIQISEVDASSGVIQCNSERLRSIDLEADTREQLLLQLESFAVISDPGRKVKLNNKVKEEKKLQIKSYENRNLALGPLKEASSNELGNSEPTLQSHRSVSIESKGTGTSSVSQANNLNDDNWRRQVWSNFRTWLKKDHSTHAQADISSGGGSSSVQAAAVQREDGRDAPWFDIVIDGANVGYYKQNFVGAPTHVDYQQIDQMLTFLISKQHKPLLVLHCRHVDEKNFPPGAEGREIGRLVQSWRATGRLFATPRSFNDDWFWLYAAVKHNSMVITNDEMRDHHFQLLSPRWFTRWKERHQVHFHYGRWKRKRATQFSERNDGIQDDGDEDSSGFDPPADGDEHGRSTLDHATTTDAAAATSSAHDAYLQQSTVDPAGAVDVDVEEYGYEDENDDCDCSVDDSLRSATLSRPVLLQWPLPYSKRMQLVKGPRFHGYYFPPPPIDSPGNNVVEYRYSSANKKLLEKWLCVYAENL